MTQFERELLDCQPGLYRFAMKLHRLDSVRAEDLVQAVLLRALEKRHQYQPGTNLKGWVTRIMFNMFVGAYRRDQRMVEDPDGHHALQSSVEASQAIREELRDAIDVFNTLTPAHQQAITTVGVLGHNYADASDIMGVPIGTVKSMVHRARATLTKRYEEA